MRIVVLGTRGFPRVQGGVETHCENLYKHLVNLGCQVTVLGRKPYLGKTTYEYNKVKIIPLPCPKRRSIEAISHSLYGVFVARIIGCDILHVHAVGPSLVIPLARFLGMKVVMTNHGPDYKREKWGIIAKTALKLGEILGSRWANAIICVSENIAEDIGTKYKKRVAFIPNGVNSPEISQSDDTLRKYGLIDKKYVLAVGRFCAEKGFHDLVDAFNMLNEEHSDPTNPAYKLVIVGSADHPDVYSEKLIKRSKDNSNVVFTGFLSGQPLQELYGHAGLFVLPSYHEGLPIVLLEALSYKLSCIASDIPPIRNMNLLSKERYFLPKNSKDLAQKLKIFIDKPLSKEEMNFQSNKLSEKYSWKKIAAQTFEIFNQALAR